MPKSTPTSSSAVSARRRSPGSRRTLAGERDERHGGRRDVALHVERAATPHLAVDEVARPGVARPLGGVGEHRVGVRHQQEARAVASGKPRDEVRPLGRLRDELARDAVSSQVRGQEVGGARLVAGWVDGVEPKQLLEELRSPPRGASLRFGLRARRQLVAHLPELGEDDRLRRAGRAPRRASPASRRRCRRSRGRPRGSAARATSGTTRRARRATLRGGTARRARGARRRRRRVRARPPGGGRGTPRRAAGAPRRSVRQPGESNPLP